MKELTLIGASGFVGTAIKNEALSRGYRVNALVRNTDKVEQNDKVKAIEVDVMNEDALVSLLQGQTAIISAYNPGWNNPNIYDDLLKGYTTIMRAAKKAELKRILIVGGAATLFVKPNVTVLDAGFIPTEIMAGVKSLADFYTEHLLYEKNIDWVFFSPAGNLAPGERTGTYRLGKDELIVDVNGQSAISVEDYAKAMLDEFENQNHHTERFTIGY